MEYFNTGDRHGVNKKKWAGFFINGINCVSLYNLKISLWSIFKDIGWTTV